MSTKCRNR